MQFLRTVEHLMPKVVLLRRKNDYSIQKETIPRESWTWIYRIYKSSCGYTLAQSSARIDAKSLPGSCIFRLNIPYICVHNAHFVRFDPFGSPIFFSVVPYYIRNILYRVYSSFFVVCLFLYATLSIVHLIKVFSRSLTMCRFLSRVTRTHHLDRFHWMCDV